MIKWGNIMKNIIEYFYRIEVEKIKYTNERYYILSDNETYILEECKTKIEIKTLEETQKYSNFHRIITNIQGGIITNYENINYILLKPILKENRNINLYDIETIAYLNIKNNILSTNWDKLWARKIDHFERYIMNKDIIFEFREYYDYFIGLAENAILYYQLAKKENISYGFTYNRVKNNFTLYDLYNPLNITIDPIIKGIAEYIKEEFFIGNAIDIEEIEVLNLNYDESILLISRLLFPTQFFDIYRNGKEENKEKISKIINLAPQYEKYIKTILKAIKKKYKYIPQIKWLTSNQL